MALEDHVPASCAKAATTTDIAIRAEVQSTPVAVDVSHFAEPAAMGFFGSATEADVDKALDDVLRGLRAVEGLEEGRLAGHVSKGYASADFARFVEKAVKAKLKAEAKRLIRASPAGGVIQGEFGRFAANAAATVEVALSLVYEVLGQKWEAVARVGVVENYAHVDRELAEVFDVRKRDVVHFLRYKVGDVVYGGARAKGVVVLVFLGGEKTIRVEVLAKSAAGPLPVRFEEVECGGERWVRLAMVKIHRPSGTEKCVAQIRPRLRLVAYVSGDAAGVEGLRGLLVTDASGKVIGTPDPLLIKLFVRHFEKVEVEVADVTHTKAGPVLKFRAKALDEEPFKEIFGYIAERYGKSLEKVVREAKVMWLETMRKLGADIIQVANKAEEVGKRDGVEEGRKALVEGLKHLFEEKEREALNVGRSDDALAIAVAGRLMVGIVNSQKEWLSLLVGDGVMEIGGKTLGFSAKYAEVAEAVLRLLAVWAGAYGAEIRAKKHETVYTSAEDAAKVLKAIFTGEVLEYATSLAKSWSGLASSHAPKLISLLALAQLLGVVKGKWAVELWLAHKAIATSVKPEAAKALDRLLARVEGVCKEEWTEGGVSLYFNLGGMESAERVATFRLYTDFRNFYLYCHTCSETSARRVLGAVAEWLWPAVERLGLAANEWLKWYGNALILPADMGWPIFLELWKKYNMSLPVEEGGRELLRVEVLDARPDGAARFRLWYYKWHETRSEQPYVDFEIGPYQRSDNRIRFRGYISASKAKGILRDHLAEIAELLKRKGMKGVSLRGGGKVLEFSGAFRNSVLSKLGISPELPRAEPVAVEHLGGYRFKVGSCEVEFDRGYVKGGYEYYAELRLVSNEEAVCFAASLRAVGVDVKVAGNVVRLDSDSFFGLLAAANAVPPSLTPLYCSDDLHVYASIEEGRVKYYFVVKHKGVWRVVEGLYAENRVQLKRAECEVLEAVKSAVAKALVRLGHPAEVGEPGEIKDKEGNVKAYYLLLYGPHLTPFLEYAAKGVEVGPAETRLEGRRIAVKAGGVETNVEFKLLKGKEAAHLSANNMGQTLAVYKSLKALGVPVEITPGGVKVNGEALWALMTVAVEKVVERGALRGLPVEVVPGVELLRVYNASGIKMYAFRAEGAHYYLAVKTGRGWRADGGKYNGKQVLIHGEAARAVAEAINAIYSGIGVERRVEVKLYKGTSYIYLTNEDLKLLGIR